MGVDLLPALDREKSYQPEKWGPQHQMILALKASGFRNIEIAARLGYTESRVSIILNDPRAKQEIEVLARKISENVTDVGVKLRLVANEAFEEIVDEMRTAGDAKVRQKASFGLLDRAGYTPVQKHLVGKATLPDSVAERAEKTAKDMKEIVGRYRYSSPLSSPGLDTEASEEVEAEVVREAAVREENGAPPTTRAAGLDTGGAADAGESVEEGEVAESPAEKEAEG